VVGPRLPSLEHILADPETHGQEEEIVWYGQGKRKVQWCSGTALWYRFGSPLLPIRRVLTRDPSGHTEPKALMYTNQNLQALDIICTVMKRWPLETTFEESRAYLGIETQRQWSDPAIERATPLLFGLYSLLALAGIHLERTGHLRVEQTAWYHKAQPPFHDVLACLRRLIWLAESNQTSLCDPEVGLLAWLPCFTLPAGSCNCTMSSSEGAASFSQRIKSRRERLSQENSRSPTHRLGCFVASRLFAGSSSAG
jgi:hypothetical protein